MDFMGIIGRSHPLWVHLPIGIIVLGLLLYWRSWFGSRTDGRLLGFIFGAGAVTATISCISGYTLSLSSAQDDAVLTHRNAAIALTLISFLFWWLLRTGHHRKVTNGVSVVLAIMLSLTGHQGGSLTHGEGFLWNGSAEKKPVRKSIANINDATVYADIIYPILQEKCASCHGPRKQKGKLRLDGHADILKGGKNGAAVVAGNTEKSKMLYRILLPPDDDDHMPPKEKGQLTRSEIALIKWWIATGASATAKVKDLQQDAEIKTVLATYHSGRTEGSNAEPVLPEVPPADRSQIDALRKAGAVATPVAQGSNLLYVSLINCTVISDSVMNALNGVSSQLYWLKAEGPLVNDKLVSQLPKFKQLRQLSLANSSVTEASRNLLGSMKSLERVNLYGTVLDSSGVKQRLQ